jgi:hypothetical protein
MVPKQLELPLRFYSAATARQIEMEAYTDRLLKEALQAARREGAPHGCVHPAYRGGHDAKEAAARSASRRRLRFRDTAV